MSDQKENLSKKQQDALLKFAARQINSDEESVKAAAGSGDVDSLISGMSPDKADKVKNILNDKESLSKLLSSQKAKSLLNKFLGENK